MIQFPASNIQYFVFNLAFFSSELVLVILQIQQIIVTEEPTTNYRFIQTVESKRLWTTLQLLKLCTQTSRRNLFFLDITSTFD